MKPVRMTMVDRNSVGRRQGVDRRLGQWLALLVAILTLGLMLNTAVMAYDAPPKDQGHTGSDADGPDEQNPEDPDQAEAGDPVQVASGNFVTSAQDLFLDSYGLPSLVQRSYNSLDTGYDGPLGPGWSLSYVMSILEVTDTVQEDLDGDGSLDDDEVVTVEQVILRDDTGVRHTFVRRADGSYRSGRGRYGNLVRTGAGAYTWTRQDGIRFFFNQGRLLEIVDPNGNRLSAGYDLQGRLASVTNPAGRTLTYSYGANSKVSGISDSGGRSVGYGYDEQNRLVRVTNPLGHATTYAYDSQDRLTRINSPQGDALVTNSYDADSRVTQQFSFGGSFTYTYRDGYTQVRNPRGHTSTHYFNESGNRIRLDDERGYDTYFTWDDESNLTGVRDARGYTTTFEYDQRGNLVRITDPRDAVTTYSYDPAYNRITGVTDALGRTSTFSYDARANLTGITDPLNQQEAFEYDGRGLLLRHVDKAGNATTYQYDELGQLIRTVDRLGNPTTFGYDDLGRLVSVTDGAGHTTRYELDALDRRVREIDALGAITAFAYNENNNLVTVTDPLGHITRYAYTPYGKLSRITSPLGNHRDHEYDSAGNLIAVIDPTGRRTEFGYDRTNLLTQIERPDDTLVRYEYDGTGNRTRQINPKNVATTYQYDPLGQLTRIGFADGTTTTMGYDDVGRRTRIVDRKGQSFDYTFDLLDRLILTQLPNDGAITRAYDRLDNLVQVAGYAGTISLSYDAESYLTAQTGVFDQTVAYEYDSEGRVTRVTRPGEYQVDYHYDAKGRLNRAVTPSGTVFYEYDGADRLIREQLPNGVTVTYDYDDDDNLLQVVHLHPDGATILASFGYEYDGAGMIAAMTEAGGARTEYGYDPLYRLTAETLRAPDGTVLSTTTYTYDTNGNRLLRDRDGVVTTYAYNDLDELQTDSLGTYTYDDNGNLIQAELPGGTLSYGYDDLDRLESVTGVALGAASYAYDGFGRRVQRSEGGSTERFVHDGRQILEARDDSDHLLARYDHGLGLIATSGAGGARYYHFDGRGNTRALTDAAAGVTDTYLYDAFGAALQHSGSTPNPFIYRGDFGYYTEVAGLSQVGSRYLDHDQGRYLQVDPVRQGTNWYSYALGNPVNYADPTGEWVPLAVWCAKGAAAEVAAGAALDYAASKMTGEKFEFWSWGRLGDAALGCLTGGLAGKAAKAGKLADKLADAARRNPCACVSEGTVVMTQEGPMPIEEIEAGTRVASIDLSTGEHRFSPVATVFEKEHEGLVVDLVLDGQTLRSTGSHPFFVISGNDLDKRRPALEAEAQSSQRWSHEGRWIEASELRKGDLLFLGSGSTLEIINISYFYGIEHVFNLYVPGTHNFQVTEFGVVSHNSSPCDDFVDLTTPQRRKHILDGDKTGGGHRPGTGKPGKSEFPSGWSDDKIIHEISDVATDPASVRKPGHGGRTIVEGTRDGIDIRVIQEADGTIVSGFPTNVPRNPK